jgi:hypothetical protein
MSIDEVAENQELQKSLVSESLATLDAPFDGTDLRL